MTQRQALHQLIDDLPEQELSAVSRVLACLRSAADPILGALLRAPLDDERDDDDFDGGLSEARQELATGQEVSHEEVRRRLGLA